MKKVNRQYVDNLVNKMLNETLEERADELVSKIKTNVNELGGMEDDHPKFGKMNFSKMSPEEIEALMNDYVNSDDEDSETMRGRFFDDEDEGDDEWTELDIDSDTELDEGFDDPYIQKARGGKDYSSREFKRIPKGLKPDMRNLRDDSITPGKYFGNKMDDIADLFKRRRSDDDDYDYDFGDDDGGDLVSEMEQGLCECGSGLYEGECNECGSYGAMDEMEQGLCECGSGLYEGECNECGSYGAMDEVELDEFEDEDFLRDADEYYKKRKEKESSIGDIFQGDNPEVMKQMLIHYPELANDYYDVHMKRKMKGETDEGIYDVDDLDDSNEFDYVEEGLLDDEGDEEFDYTDEEPNEQACDFHRKHFGPNDERTKRFCKSEMTERLHGRQRVLDKNKNNKIDAEDFEMLRGKKSETKEGKKFPDLSGDGKVTRKDILLGRGVKLDKNGKKRKVKESVQLTEDEMIELIENIIKEEEKLKTIGGKPKGLSKYEQVHEKDGKQNDEYLKSVAAKMKEYLKDGSKGEYTESPKHFPKSNGQLAKMKAKKYTMSDDGNEFLNSYMRPGMEDLVPEEIEYDEDWVSDAIEGSARTGNKPEWANAEKTDLGKKINKKRKDKKFHKAKETAYRKTRVPVSDGTGENSGSGIHIKESDTKEGKILNEEFNKIQHLMLYSRKTQ